ncbi:MAG: 4Fe-4S cluster-binding domain-containing protein [Termitinemataceae bacterium]|nr:MAG: 4Fe-4S cluster-binding domain-containing protein [Termitinemataceae bacterium]
MKEKELRFSPSLCLTHDCNLSCIYCYQKHDSGKRMSLITAKQSIDWIFENVPNDLNAIEISFIGGEPLLEFDLIKEIVQYANCKKTKYRHIFYATTNGTLLTNEMKSWFSKNKNIFWLGLSLDGTRETHNFNRSNSYDKIDIDFFRTTWPEQSIKMTLSEYSLKHLADNIIYIHSLGFTYIAGVNLFEGDFKWDKDDYIKEFIPQLKKLVDFYLSNDTLLLNQMFDKRIDLCEVQNKEHRKWCGIGNGTCFFDIDGQKYPCSFITPMTFSYDDLLEIKKTDFLNDECFLDNDCLENCYIYPVCPSCSGANYMVNKTFKKRNKSKCKIQKLITLFIADIQAKKILRDRSNMDDNTLYHTIEAIKKIRKLYFDEFKEYLGK